MYFLIFLFPIIRGISPSHDLVFPIRFDESGIPGIPVESDGYNYTVHIDTRSNGAYLPDDIPDSDAFLTLVAVNGRVDVGRDFFVHNALSTESGSIGIGRGSNFARLFPSLMLLPTESIGGARLITEPADPAQYCTDHQMTYIHTSSQNLRVHVDLIYENEPRSSNDQLALNITEFNIRIRLEDDYIPHRQYTEILQIIESIVRVRSAGITTMVSGCTEDLFNALPSIEYTLMTSEHGSNPALRIVFSPHDYLHPTHPGECVLRVHRATNMNVFGMNFLSKVGLFIDYSRSRMGFCDPL